MKTPNAFQRTREELYRAFFGNESVPEPGRKPTVLPHTVGLAQLHVETHLSQGQSRSLASTAQVTEFEILVETITFVKNSGIVLTKILLNTR